MPEILEPTGKVGFCIGTGRCGTLFYYELAAREPRVASSHERNPDNEAFQRYCKWHGLPVDDAGFLSAKEREIRDDLKDRDFSFEASPYLSLSVRELHARFGAKFIQLVRRPDRVVTSFVHKGFYRHPYVVGDASLATGYQNVGQERVHAFFARIAPTGEHFERWNLMTPVGKVAWYWRVWNERTNELLSTLPADSYRIVRVEDLDHAKYCDLARFLGYQPQVTQADFDALSDSKPHAFWNKRNIDQWSPQEIKEYEAQVGGLAGDLGYEYRIAALTAEAQAERADSERLGRIASKPQGPQFWRVRRSASAMLHGLGARLQAMADRIGVD